MEDLRVLFNTAGNSEMGMGHVYTSIKLSKKFKDEYHARVLFLLSSDSRGMDLIEKNNGKFKVLNQDNIVGYIEEIRSFSPNVVINDIIYIKKEFMRRLRSVNALVVNMEHTKEPLSVEYADVIFNSLYPPPNKPLRGKYYYGPKYAPLTDSFKDLPTKKINKDCKNFFVCFGGADPNGFTINAINSLSNLNDIKAKVIIGPGFNYHRELEELLEQVDKNKFDLIKGAIDLYPYIKQADIGIASGGNTIYELAAVGVPTIVFSQNSMEEDRTRLFSNYGIIVNLGNGNITSDDLTSNVKKLMSNYDLRKKMSEKGQKLVDGYGLERIVSIIIRNLKK